MPERSERKRRETTRRRKRDGRDREEKCTPLRSKARAHCEDCTMEYCMEYAQTKPPLRCCATPPSRRPTDNIAGRRHQG